MASSSTAGPTADVDVVVVGRGMAVSTRPIACVRDEGGAYGMALQAAGVPVRMRRFAGQMQGFFSMVGVVPGHDEGVGFVADERERLVQDSGV